METSDTVAGERSLARSLLYQVLAAAFRYPSREGLHPALLSEETLHGLSEVLVRPADLDVLLEEAREGLRASTPEELEAAYVGLFGHTVRGACPPYESEYGESRGSIHVPHDLSDVGAFYRAFGLQVSSQRRERVDHIAAECEFLQFLTYKQAHAQESGLDDLAAVTVKAQTTFLRAHLGRWAPAFFRRVAHADRGGVYEGLARLGNAFVRADCSELGIEPGSERLRLIVRTETRDDVFDCGVPVECPGAGDRPGPSDPPSGCDATPA